MQPDQTDREPAEAAPGWPAHQLLPDTAADWVLYHQNHDITDMDQTGAAAAAFERWLALSPANRAEYEDISGIWSGLGQLADDPLVHKVNPDKPSVLGIKPRKRAQPLHKQPGLRGKAGFIWQVPALAAGLLLAFFALHMIQETSFFEDRAQDIRTAVGEQRTLMLADGTTVTLNTGTRLRVVVNAEERLLELLSGEAHLDVAHDASRPFVVHSGDAKIRVLGTAFDVQRLEDGRVRVAVLRGRVQVAHVLRTEGGKRQEMVVLGAAEKALVSAGDPGRAGTAIVTGPADVERLTSWRYGLLDLTGQTLGAAVAEVNRYSKTRILIADDSIRDLPVNAVFHIGDLGGFVPAMERLLPVRATRGEDRTIILSSAH